MGPLHRSHPRPPRLPPAARRVLPRSAAALGAAAALAALGCGGDSSGEDGGLGDPPPPPSPQKPVHPLPPGKPDKRGSGARGTEDRPRIRPARCPAGAANCASAVGTVLWIESVDPDGDGDLHVVATATQGDAVTGSGLVVFDVRRDLRPARDPQRDDVVTGAGPVFRGSYGQRQIQVDEFRVARR